MLKLSRESDGSLTTLANGRTHVNATVVRAAPLSDPGRYISVLDANGEEICLITDPSELDEEARSVLRADLDRRYLTFAVRRINALRVEPGSSYVDLDTDQGRRDVVLQDADECVRMFGRRLLLVDVDGNRFEIPDMHELDRRSAKMIGRLLQTLGIVD